ncbi:MAG: type I methionyl aminopeptidase [Syntrophomonadaceae bacterium]|nr:type I methionyl aminopeptidase [Syntrophomonadaceae bacterium]
MIIIKSKKELECMRQAGLIVADTLERLAGLVKPGITTATLDRFAEDYLAKRGAKPAFKGYKGFPASICASVNQEVVHGIPGKRRLKEGDIISIDLGAIVDGWYGDAAITVPVGEVDPEIMRLLKVTEESLYLGIEAARPGVRLGVVSNTIQKHVEKAGFSVVRQYVGHGIGRQMHEDPPVPNFGRPDRGPLLEEGMTIAIEPMVNAGGYEVVVAPDNWTVITKDGSFSAHFEHTIAITSNGPEILTRK